MHRNQRAGIVVTAIHQYHSHAQLSDHPLIKGLQAPIVMKSNQQAVKLKVEADRSEPVSLPHGTLIAFHRVA